MVSYFGLYYPFIHFKDEGWLKLTALYWDGMMRIVPAGAQLRDSDEVKRLVDADIVRNVQPAKWASSIAPAFGELVATHGDVLRAQLGVERRSEWPDDPYSRLYAPTGTDTKLAYVFDQKIEPDLLSTLFACGLVTTRSADPRWIGMHPRLANLYMMSLAEAAAHDLGAHPLTDEAFDHIAVSGLTMERLAAALLGDPALTQVHPDREVEVHMASLALRYAIPASPADLSAAKLVEFRDRYAEERGMFQAEIAKLTAGLTVLDEVKDVREVERHLSSEYHKTLKPRLDRLEAGLKRARIDTVQSTIGTSFALPAGAATLLAAAGMAVAAPLAAAAGIAFGTWTIWRKHQTAREEVLKPSPEAYLYQASELLTPKGLARRITADSRSFTA